MRIVIDSNQLSLFLSKINPPGVVHGEGITIAPYVFAEMLLHPDAQQLVRQLRSFDILVGLEPSDVMAELSALDEKAIVSFMPYNPTFTLPTRLEGQDISLARSIKASNRAFANTMFGCAKHFRKRLRDEGLKHKFSGMSEVLELSFLQSLVFDSVSHKQARTLAVPDEKYLYVAVMHNRYLSRYFKMILCYVISYSRAWADQTWNFDPSGNIDDWTDITLPLYAADGDIILTADKKLRTAISIIERPDAVHVKTVQEL